MQPKNTRKHRPSNLSFLQAQILERIYLNISKNKTINISQLSKISDYPENSQILDKAINSIINKNFIKGNIKDGFLVPDERLEFFKSVINKSEYKTKSYSNKIINHINGNGATPQLELFSDSKGVSYINKKGLVHRWYDYLEDFPYSLIENKIKEYNLTKDSLVVDPFSGSGTTMVSANLFQMNSVAFDANPLMTFITKVKCHWEIDISKLKKTIINVTNEFIAKVKKLDDNTYKNGFLKGMPKKELNQWLSPRLQQEVSLLKEIISNIKTKDIREIFLLAMAKSCFGASFVSLCPGTTFYPFRQKEEFWDIFNNKMIQIYDDLLELKKYDNYGNTSTITDSCINAQKYLEPESIDFIITSPPYPNDLEYTRQTRLELYLLDFVKNMDDIQNIKRKMAKGSTKLIFKESNSENHINNFHSIKKISDKIYEQTRDKNWGFDYPRMVREYFGDMYLVMKNFYPLMKTPSHFLLVVGDQTIKGVFIPVCDILIELAQDIGFRNCRKEEFRIRRSTGHDIPLPEDIVILEK